jgi:hypothetical protein
MRLTVSVASLQSPEKLPSLAQLQLVSKSAAALEHQLGLDAGIESCQNESQGNLLSLPSSCAKTDIILIKRYSSILVGPGQHSNKLSIDSHHLVK